MEPAARRAGLPRRRRVVRRRGRLRAARARDAGSGSGSNGSIASSRSRGGSGSAICHDELRVRRDGRRARSCGSSSRVSGRPPGRPAPERWSARPRAHPVNPPSPTSSRRATRDRRCSPCCSASHPEICTTGELKATSLGDPDRYRCSCGCSSGSAASGPTSHARMAARGLAVRHHARDTHIELGRDAVRTDGCCGRWCAGRRSKRCASAALASAPSWHSHLAQFQRAQRVRWSQRCADTRARAWWWTRRRSASG